MANGMWTAAAGAVAQSQSLDVIANNLANTDTSAFKKDIPTFKEYLATVERTHDTADIPRSPIKDKDFYPLDGRDQAYVVTDGIHTSFRQGNLRNTQSQLDIALDGPGFFEVSTPYGAQFTRQGNLKIASDGKLVTVEGFPVLSKEPAGLSMGSNSLSARYINLRDRGGLFGINANGQIYSGENLISQINIIEFKDLSKLKKLGGQLYENKDTNNIVNPEHTQVRQGFLESSNVNPIEEMTRMIQANRLFEHDLKALKTYGELLGKEANEVGKL